MASLKFFDRTVTSRDEETVLDAFLRTGINIPFSCRNGVCHVCMQHCTKGEIPPVAQNGLKDELQKEGYFLACKCVPITDMEIKPPSALFSTTVLYSKEMLTPHICKLLIEPPTGFNYRAGQFINLRRSDGLVRSYSLASLPGEDYFLELHVQRKEGGSMSNWILDKLKPGDGVDIQNATGDCTYVDEAQGHPMLMIGTGTGMAPLFGILRDALQKQHTGEIHLYQGAQNADRLYLRQQLRELEQQHANFHYHECLSDESNPPEGMLTGLVHEAAFKRHHDVRGWHIYLAGRAEMVDSGSMLAAEHGAAPHAIHADAFVFRDLREQERRRPKQTSSDIDLEDKGKYPPPDPELWAALDHGEKLTAVLKDFYGRVFQDERMSSFFEGTTQQRSIEKQYLFMRQILTGDKIYFGDRPRNSHHWMVISDELFDYRQSIMFTCLREHGLSEEMIERFRAIEDFYRDDIVKDKAFPRKMGDVELPLDGFGEITMDVGTLCDSCSREVQIGEKVMYHVRLGKIYCTDCSSQHEHKVEAS